MLAQTRDAQSHFFLPVSQPSDISIRALEAPQTCCWLPGDPQCKVWSEVKYSISVFHPLPELQQGRKILEEMRSPRVPPMGAISLPGCTAVHVSQGAGDVVWCRPACQLRVWLRNEWFLLFPRGERSERSPHTHTKSISRWVSGNSSFNYSSPLSWAQALQVGSTMENWEGQSLGVCRDHWGCWR